MAPGHPPWDGVFPLMEPFVDRSTSHVSVVQILDVVQRQDMALSAVGDSERTPLPPLFKDRRTGWLLLAHFCLFLSLKHRRLVCGVLQWQIPSSLLSGCMERCPFVLFPILIFVLSEGNPFNVFVRIGLFACVLATHVFQFGEHVF